MDLTLFILLLVLSFIGYQFYRRNELKKIIVTQASFNNSLTFPNTTSDFS